MSDRYPGTSPLPHYHAYVLRQWRESEDGPWRYSLQLAECGERHGFASLAQLVAYLQQRADAPDDCVPPEQTDRSNCIPQR